jgi:hypothetical protein
MPEWLMGADCKSAGYTYVSSNLTRPIHTTFEGKKHTSARVAQW